MMINTNSTIFEKNQTNYQNNTTNDVASQLGHRFQDFNLKKQLLLAIQQKQWYIPSPVQQYSIPAILQGKSVIVKAKNGTGKTGSFLIPIINSINPQKNALQALILVPVRELTVQIYQIAKDLGKHLNISCESITGGEGNLKGYIQKMSKPIHLLIGTPPKIFDLIEKNVLNLRDCNFLVLDEADKLFQQIFYFAIQKIIPEMNPNRQLLLFSATFPKNSQTFIDKFVPHICAINLTKQLTLQGISQYYLFINQKQKLLCLRKLLNQLEIKKTIIFTRNYKTTQYVAKKMVDMGYPTLYCHSRMETSARKKVFQQFTVNECRFIVATDVLGRGMDVLKLNVVINFDFPKNYQEYLHRIGRSGRFGHRGVAINLITEDDKQDLLRIEKQLDTEINEYPKQGISRYLYCI